MLRSAAACCKHTLCLNGVSSIGPCASCCCHAAGLAMLLCSVVTVGTNQLLLGTCTYWAPRSFHGPLILIQCIRRRSDLLPRVTQQLQQNSKGVCWCHTRMAGVMPLRTEMKRNCFHLQTRCQHGAVGIDSSFLRKGKQPSEGQPKQMIGAQTSSRLIQHC